MRVHGGPRFSRASAGRRREYREMTLKRIAAWFLKSPRGAAVLVILVALVLRVGFAVWYVGVNEIKHASVPWFSLDRSVQAILDADGYTDHAREIVWDGPYRRTSKQPLVPLYHALVFAVFGEHPTLFYNRLADAVVAALGCGVVYLLARRMFGQTVGLIAGLLAATNANMIHKSGYIFSETWAVPLCALALYFFVGFADSRKWRDLVLGAVFLGLATLARATTYHMIYLLPLWLWVVYGRVNRRMLVRSAALVGIVVVMILPWAIRISILDGQVTAVSTRLWTVLGGAYGPAQFEQPLGDNKGLWIEPWDSGLFTAAELKDLAPLSELQRQPAFKRRFFEYLPTIWYRVPDLMLCRMVTFIGPSSRSGLFFRAYEAQQTVLFVLFLGGLWIARAQWRRFSILYLAYLYLGVFQILILYGGSRNRLYSDPIILAFAAAYLVWLCERFLRRRAGTQKAANAVAPDRRA